MRHSDEELVRQLESYKKQYNNSISDSHEAIVCALMKAYQVVTGTPSWDDKLADKFRDLLSTYRG